MKTYKLFPYFLLFNLSYAHAQGPLDTTFNHSGTISDSGAVYSLAVQDNGKILGCGPKWMGAQVSVLTRFNEDGPVDPTFANNGYYFLYPPYLHKSTYKHVFLFSNKIYLVGGIDSFASDFLITRLNANGTIDNNFGDGGVTVTNLVHIENGTWIYNSQDRAISLSLQSDEKMLVLGACEGNIALVRYTSNGIVDSTFGQYGIAIQHVGLYDNEPNDLAVLPDDRLIAGFRASVNGQGAMCAMRFLPDGSIDSSFNQIGFASFSKGWLTYCNAMCLQPDGKILLAGYADSALIVRFDSTGALDPSFGNGGIAKLSPAAIRDMVLAPDGKILLTGTCDDDFIIYRCLSNGTPDNSFGIRGAIITNIEQGEEDRAETIALQQDGKILVGGNAQFPGTNTPEYVLARYLPNDESPGNEGLLQVFPNPAEHILQVKWKGNQPLQADIYIYDMLGRSLLYKPDQVLSSQERSLDISAFLPGVYFVKISGKNGLKEARKFVKK